MTGAHNKVLDRRVHDLDTIAAVLPIERRDELAELLTDQDVETLRHLVNEGMGANTLRALTSDLAYRGQNKSSAKSYAKSERNENLRSVP